MPPRTATALSLAGILAACGPQESGCDTAERRFDLWERGCLRGANMYQDDAMRTDSGGDFGPRLVPEDLEDLADAGANLVVFSVPGPWHVRTPVPWPEAADHLAFLIDAAVHADLFAVIALRTGPGRGEGDITDQGLTDHSVWSDPVEQEAWIAMWSELADAYAAHPAVAGFDLMVEPHDVAPATWRSLADRILGGIRDVSDDVPILVGPADWGGVDALQRWTPPDDPHLVTTVHQYEPYAYTNLQQTTFTRSEIDALYEAIDAWRERTDRVVSVGEFGVARHKPDAAGFLQASVDWMDELGVCHAAWLWEVADPGGYRRFDFKQDPEQLAVFADSWSRNEVWPSSYAGRGH